LQYVNIALPLQETMKTTCILASMAAVVASKPTERHEGLSVRRVYINTAEEADAFAKLADVQQYDIFGTAEDGGIDYAAPTMDDSMFMTTMNVTETSSDLQKDIDAFFATEPVCEKGLNACIQDDSFFEQYQRLDAIHARMDAKASESQLIELMSLGTSYEGRPLRGWKVTGSSGFDQGKKKAIYNCGLHAREWIPPAFCMYGVEHLAAQYGVDPRVTELMDKFEIHTIPIINPDGYEYSHTTNSMWRKSRKPNAGSTAVGTDLNRNFNYQWGTGGSSNQPNNDSYMGEYPLDNVESQALADYWTSQMPDAMIQMDIHAYGLMWMQPYGYIAKSQCFIDPRGCGVESDEDYKGQFECAEASRDAIVTESGNRFDIGPITNVIYQASGSTCDHAYALNGIKYAYALEVRGRSFQPPPNEIVGSNEELFEGMIAQLAYVAQNEGL